MTLRSRRLVVVGAALIAALAGYGAYRHFERKTPAPERPAAVKRAPAVPVAVTEARRRPFEESVRAHGVLKARNFALVSPRIHGVIEKVFVREGDEVIAGKTPLFQTDSLKLQQAVEVARQNLNVSRCTRVEKEANAESVDADAAKAELDFERGRKLYEDKAISLDAFEVRQTAAQKMRAMRKHAQSFVTLALAEEKKSETTLSMAEKDLRDSLVLAPISGRVSRRMAEPGEMGTPGAPILRIDDVTTLEASAYLPSQYYGRVEPGRTPARVGTGDTARARVGVTYRSPTIDQALRTFEIKCAVDGNSDWAVPGALIEVAALLTEREALGVPVEAVLTRAGKKVVFVPDNDTARVRALRTGLETDGWIEIEGAGLAPGVPVIVKGQFLLNDGAAIATGARKGKD
jgi:RND family efflux transporter MFP subunit